jgi:excisionase family DNA binding protein
MDTRPIIVYTCVMDEFITVGDAARELGIGRSALHSRIKRGEIRAIRVSPRLLLIPRSEVERWRDKGKLKPGPKPRGKPEREGTGQ